MPSVVFYDGVCGLCNGFVRFLLPRDRQARLRFAPLQGRLARTALARHGGAPSDLDTVYVIADWRQPTERALVKSRAFGVTTSYVAQAFRPAPGVTPTYVAQAFRPASEALQCPACGTDCASCLSF